MCDFSIAVREEVKASILIDNVNSIMESLSLTLEQALKALHVSEEEYLNYKALAGAD